MRTSLPTLNGRTIGFDQFSEMLDRLTSEVPGNYPPYDIEKIDENTYTLRVAVAGFKPEQIDIEVESETLKISAKAEEANDKEKVYLHKGIAQRSFDRKFQLAPHMVVTEAKNENGLLSVTIVREIPETMKPRKIAITQA